MVDEPVFFLSSELAPSLNHRIETPFHVLVVIFVVQDVVVQRVPVSGVQ